MSRVPLSALWTAPLGYWLYLERAGPRGLSGWIAPRQPLAAATIDIRGADFAFQAPLRPDPDLLAGRRLYRFDCPVPLQRANVLTLRFGAHALTVLARDASANRAPLVLPALDLAAHAPMPSAPKGGRTLVVMSPIDWSFRRQRSQHLTQALAAHYDTTLFLGPASLRLEGAIFPVEHGIGLPLIGAAPDCDLATRALTEEEGEACADRLRRHLPDAPIDVLVQFPSWFDVARRLTNARLIYDCIDLHTALPHVSAPLAPLEAELIQRADLCLATSGGLLDHLNSGGAQRAVLSPNAATPPHPESWPPQRDNTILYVGAVEDWFDFEIARAIAAAIPDATLTVVGACSVTPPSGLPRNITFLGEQSHAEALDAMTHARVGIIPFKRGTLTDAVNPVKAYEYLAAGLPVVMTPMGGAELSDAPGVRIAQTPALFAEAAQQLFTDTSDADRRSFAAWAAGQTWDARAASIIALLGHG